MDGVSTAGDVLRVDRDNVLRIGRAFQDHADDLRTRLADYRRRLRVEPALGDPASADMAREMNTRLADGPDSVVARIERYIGELAATALSCQQAARGYEYTEDEIAAVFRGTGPR